MAGPKRYAIPSEAVIRSVYPRLNLTEAGKHFGIGQTLFLKWLEHYGIERSRKPRQERTEQHSRAIADAIRGSTRSRSGKYKNCATCGVHFYVSPARLRQADVHYCSHECLNAAKFVDLGTKTCPQCGDVFSRQQGESAGNYRKKIYCSIACSTAAHPPPVMSGDANPRYKGDSARKRQPGTVRFFVFKALNKAGLLAGPMDILRDRLSKAFTVGDRELVHGVFPLPGRSPPIGCDVAQRKP